MNTQPITLEKALGRATVAEKQHLALVHAELQQLRSEGLCVPVDAIELCLLERNGYVYDFSTGQVLEESS